MVTLSNGTGNQPVSRDYRDHLGVFKTLDDVPPRYRLSRFASKIKGIDVWGEWIETEKSHLAESTLNQTYGLCERRWKPYMKEQGQHHALATPEDVEGFLSEQIEQASMKTIYQSRYNPLLLFYKWLMFHTDYDHVYNPVVMAAGKEGMAHELWNYRMDILENK